MSEPRLIIFDLDGTLVDTVALVVASFSSAFNALGHIAPTDKEIRSISGLRLDIALRTLAPTLEEVELTKIGEKYRHTYLTSINPSLDEPLFLGALETLNELNKRKNYLLAIATGKPLLGTRRILKAHNIIDHFTSLQTPDNNASKPNPEMIFSAMSAVGALKENTIMIGDTTHDMFTAKAAGVKSIGVGWGYHTKQDLQNAGANVFIDEYREMINTIDELYNA